MADGKLIVWPHTLHPSVPFAVPRLSLIPSPRRPLHHIVASASSSSAPQQLSVANDASWKSFSKHVSGEWDGYGAEFSSLGDPHELPSAVVPEAFREWEVQLYDWQTQCPTIANDSLHYKLIRLLPTVGCEADASTQYSVDDRNAGDPSSGAEFLAYHNNGSYIAMWPGKRVLKERFTGNPSKVYSHEGDKLNFFEVEHCLVQEGELKFRVRILQQVKLEPSKEGRGNVPVIKNITVQREKWESEFRDGEVLGGCSTSGAAFAKTPVLRSSELLGSWHYEEFSSQSEPCKVGVYQLVHSGSGKVSMPSSDDMLPLPKGLWTTIAEMEHGHYSLDVGWLVDQDVIMSSKFEFSNVGKAKKAYMRFKRKAG